MPRRKKINYSRTLCTFDIETTHEVIDGKDCLYTWHWQAMRGDEYYTFKNWQECLDTIVSWCDAERLIVFVHNLSYETEAIIRNLHGHEITEVFATDTHKMLKFLLDDKIEFRCSYYLTNKSLADCARDVGLYKLDMDYKQIRHPGDATDADELYCVWDVLIMVHKIRQLEKAEGMDFWDFPLTNTGFLRKELRRLMAKNKHNRYLFKKSYLNVKQFLLCKDAFMGGYTHSNHIYTGEVMHVVDSYDYGSAYPFAMLVHKYPMGAFHRVDNPDVNDLLYMLKKPNILFICRVAFRNIVSRRNNTYISFSKCKTAEDVQLDNGRVYSASYLEIACTCLDFEIIRKAYEISGGCKVLELYWAVADYLPDEYVKLMLKYYEDKQKLKHVEGAEIDYMKAKNRVNSFYGMAVTSPVHDEIILDGVDWDKVRIDFSDPAALQPQLDKFYDSFNSFLPYQWGVFVPAYTRYHLWHDFILAKAEDGTYPCDHYSVYFDTDSAKIIDREKCLFAIDKYNEWATAARQKRLKALGYEIDFPDLGVFDWETEKTGPWEGFKTLGAKKYCVYTGGQFYTTVSGLSKSAARYIRTFDDFSPGTLFDEDVSGRTASHCITNVVDCYGDGGGCWIENVTYKLGISEDFDNYLEYPDRFAYSRLTIHKDSYEIRDSENVYDDNYIDLKVIRDKRNLYGVTNI